MSGNRFLKDDETDDGEPTEVTEKSERRGTFSQVQGAPGEESGIEKYNV